MSARVSRPYTAGSRVPSKFRFGPCRMRTDFLPFADRELFNLFPEISAKLMHLPCNVATDNRRRDSGREHGRECCLDLLLRDSTELAMGDDTFSVKDNSKGQSSCRITQLAH